MGSGETKRHPPIQVPMWETTSGTDGFVPVPVRGTDGEKTATTTTTTTLTVIAEVRCSRYMYKGCL